MGYAARSGDGRAALLPVELSADDEFHFDRLAQALLDEALFEYDQFVSVDRRRVNPAQWKHWRQDDDVVVYRERRGAASRDNRGAPQARFTAFSTSPYLHGEPEELPNSSRSSTLKNQTTNTTTRTTTTTTTTPRLLAVGSLASSLDDVMYGIVTPTGEAMRLKASYLGSDDFVDGTVLAQIRTPTPSDPFHFVGIKWMLQRGLGIVRPRDFVFLEASGVQLRQDGSGQRVGFHIMHSVDLSQSGDASSRTKPAKSSIQRGAFSTCYLYHEMPARGALDVYMTALVQPRGNLIAPLALRSAAAMLRSNWRLLSLCAENKKLAWLLQTQRQLLLPANSAPALTVATASRCGLCSKSFKGFSATTTHKKRLSCQLCSMTVCTHCSMHRTLKSAGLARTSAVASEKMLFCKKCIALAGEESSSEIARQQLWEDEIVRTGRAHTQTALALVRRETSTGSRLHRELTEMVASSSRSSSVVLPSHSQSLSMMAYRSQQEIYSNSNSNNNSNDLRSTWHATDPGRRYHIYDQPASTNTSSYAGGKTSPSNPSLDQRASLAHGHHHHANGAASKNAAMRRTMNGTWHGSARTTETTSLGSSTVLENDRRTSLYPYPDDETSAHGGGRTSTASSAMVLLDDGKSTRRMKALDYLPVSETVASGTSASQSQSQPQSHLARTSLYTEAGYGDVEVESVYSRSSYSSSIAVLDVEQPPTQTRISSMIQEEDELAGSQYSQRPSYQQQQPQHELLYPPQCQPPPPPPPQQLRSSMLQAPRSTPTPLYPLCPDQHHQQQQQHLRRSSHVHFEQPQPVAPPALSSHDSLLARVRDSEILNSDDLQDNGQQHHQRLSYQMQLWLQMNELRDTAESTYQITQRNAQALAASSSVASSSSLSLDQPQPPHRNNLRFFSQQPMGLAPHAGFQSAPNSSTTRPPAVSMSGFRFSGPQTPVSASSPVSSSIPRAAGNTIVNAGVGSYQRRYTTSATMPH